MTGAVAPVAFFVFNRPETTRRVFAAIRAATPAVLLVVADAARDGRAGEADRVAEVRAIATAVDWPCDIRTNFADRNLGCKCRVSSGLDWVFSEVERAIILEDDCLPSPAFFRFASEMLDAYADDRRVFSISGSNFSGATDPVGHYFSNFALMWGWATWRDRWAEYDVDPAMPDAVLRRLWGGRPLAHLYWRQIFRRLTTGRIDTWDYQWILTVWRNRGLTVRPTVNLVANLGFGDGATHTHDGQSMLGALRVWDGASSLALPVAPMKADADRDAIDERRWAGISPRLVAAQAMPWLTQVRRWLR